MPAASTQHNTPGHRTGTSQSAPPPPGMDAFPTLRNPPQDDDGDAMLDALLGMDMPFETETVKSGERSRSENSDTVLA